MVGWDHTGITRMKLSSEPFLDKPFIDRVNARSHDQHRPLRAFREKVSHWSIQRSGHTNLLARLRYQGKRSGDLEHRLGRSIAKTLTSLFRREVVDLVNVGIYEIDD